MTLICLWLAIAWMGTAIAAQDLSLRTVTTGLDTPWEILWGPDGWLWVTERPGRLSRIHPETGEQQTIATLSDVYEQGESGLLGMVLHPNFADSPYVFVAYTYRDGTTILERIVRFTYQGAQLSDMRILLDRIPGATIHDGCRLLILPDRTLLITTGDANVASRAQDLQSLNGKVLRINLDGTIPADNPFPPSPIWSLGHRNAQGITFYDDIVYSSEHGPNNDDEINIIERGRNYGWPTVMGYCDSPDEQSFCQTNSVVEPIAAWTPTIAPCGLAYYAHSRIQEWQNSLLLVALKAARLVVLRLDSTRRRVLSEKHYVANQLGRLRAVCVSPDGRVFVGTSNRDGRGTPRSGDDRIVELTAATSSVPAGGSLTWYFDQEPLDPLSRMYVHLPAPSSVVLTLFDLLGRRQTAWNFGFCTEGPQWFNLDTTLVPSGAYIATLGLGAQHYSRLLLVGK
ncbi:MAG: PQQ-dependent sugar dehydrogenase [Chlorobi bacterium]|nr:PQQ-dependent sugar dehydrogenase [Chlorobiota bacterium]